MDPESHDDLVATSESKEGRPPTLPRMNTEDLIRMPVGRDETSGKLTGQLSGPSASEGPPPLLRKQSSLLKLAELRKPPLNRPPVGARGAASAATHSVQRDTTNAPPNAKDRVEVVKDLSVVVDPETRRSGAARKSSATMAARTTAQLPGQVNVTDGVSVGPESPDDLVVASKSKKGRPTLSRMNTEDLISMPVDQDETSGKLTGQLSGPSASEGPPPLLRKQSSLLKLAELKKPPLKRQPGGAWGAASAAVTDTSSKVGEGRPPPLNRVDTEDLINMDPDSPDLFRDEFTDGPGLNKRRLC